jgi:hypothetical protein
LDTVDDFLKDHNRPEQRTVPLSALETDAQQYGPQGNMATTSNSGGAISSPEDQGSISSTSSGRSSEPSAANKGSNLGDGPADMATDHNYGRGSEKRKSTGSSSYSNGAPSLKDRRSSSDEIVLHSHPDDDGPSFSSLAVPGGSDWVHCRGQFFLKWQERPYLGEEEAAK